MLLLLLGLLLCWRVTAVAAAGARVLQLVLLLQPQCLLWLFDFSAGVFNYSNNNYNCANANYNWVCPLPQIQLLLLAGSHCGSVFVCCANLPPTKPPMASLCLALPLFISFFPCQSPLGLFSFSFSYTHLLLVFYHFFWLCWLFLPLFCACLQLCWRLRCVVVSSCRLLPWFANATTFNPRNQQINKIRK